MNHKFGLLPKVLLAIALGIGCGLLVPGWVARIALTFNALFGNFLNFVIPLLILGLVAPGIAELGAKAGRLLAITAALAYAFTLFSGFGTLFASLGLLPRMLGETTPVIAPDDGGGEALRPFFTGDMPPLMGVMTALLLAFVLGLGMARIRNGKLKGMMDDFKQIIERVIARVILPLLPFYIFGIFLSITQSGQVAGILGIFLKLIAVIFLLTIVLLLIQFSIAGAVARKNPFGMLRTMLTAYMTALGTQSSAATIPVTLAQTVKLGVRPEVAGFVIPLCAT
ncbi:MAG: dicarboxylate/amino acid:cation symporter, partial [Alistipes sp.]|nr:dicarboxylate/amino acid:cation symporter [Alistipes sp.]